MRPWKPRSYATLTQAELEVGDSRVYLGVHWRSDLESKEQGKATADYVFDHGLVPPANHCSCH